MAELMTDAVNKNEKLTFPLRKPEGSLFIAKLRYWWCWLVAGSLLLFIATPALTFYGSSNGGCGFIRLHNGERKRGFVHAGQLLKSPASKISKKIAHTFSFQIIALILTRQRCFSAAGKKMGLVAKKELLKAPVLGQGMSFVNIIAIDRSNPERARQSMEKAREVMQQGYSFGVFAEGTRAMPGELLPFKKGAFHLALQTNSPIIPVAIKNTDWMMGKKTGVAYPGEIEMVVLPPIETSSLNAEDDLMELLKETRAAIASELGK